VEDDLSGAKLWGLSAAIRKRRDLKFTAILDDLPLKGWQREIDQVVFRGNILMDEVVFFHRASRTALFADLIGNFSPEFLPDKPVWRG
jgi:hypothetical protein